MNPFSIDNRYYWLDWLRFFAAFWVLAVHARAGTWVAYAELQNESRSALTAIFFASTRTGDEMVMLFFVLSGFLVGGKLLERCRDHTFAASSYVVDRISRIWVPLLPAIVLTFIVNYLIDTVPDAKVMIGHVFGLQGAFVGFMHNNPPLWSLTYEIWFYVLAGSGAALFMGQHRALALLALMLAIAVFARLNNSLSLLAVWWLGAAAYFLRIRSPALLMTGLTLVAVGTVGLELKKTSEFPVAMAANVAALPRAIPVLVLAAGLSIIVASAGKWQPKMPAVKKFEAAGSHFSAFSYSLYLVHYLALALVDCCSPASATINFASVGMFVLRLILSLLFAWCFYFCFESRTIRVRNWMNRYKNRGEIS